MRITNQQFHKIRKVYRMSTDELGKLLGYSQEYMSAIDRGVEPVTDNVVKRLCDRLAMNEEKMREIESIYEKFKVK